MNAQFRTFDKRLRKIDRHHRKLAHGYVTSVNHDGLVIARARRKGMQFPARGLFMSLAVLMVFKGFLYTNLGPSTYADRVTKLEGGTFVESLGASVMSADPVTIWLSTQINSFLK